MPRSVSARPIDVAKEKVPVVDLADPLCGPGGLRRLGAEWVARCPLPDHQDKTPSFTVNPEKNLWFCHGCVRGGDVVKLAQLAWGYAEIEMAMAAAQLLHEFGHEIPTPPPSWFAKGQRQMPVRDALQEARVQRCQRRLYRWFFRPVIEEFEDEAERQLEKRIGWEDAGKIARLLATQLREEAR